MKTRVLRELNGCIPSGADKTEFQAARLRNKYFTRRRVDMKNKILRFTAFALVLTVCVAAVFLPACLAFALGDFDPAEPPSDDPPVPEDFPYDDVYFFTNRYDALTASNRLAAGLSSRYPGSFDFHFQYYGADVGLGMNFALLSVPVKENSIVVFEIQGIASMVPDESNEIVAFLSALNDVLESLFGGWQSDGCRIIFVNDTEEVRMLDVNLDFYTSPYTEFLEYVDVHINTDFFTLFIDTILYTHFTNDKRIENFTFLMDTSYGTSIEEFVGKWLFNEYLVKYIIMTDLLNFYVYRNNPIEYLNFRNIDFIFYYANSDSLSDLGELLYEKSEENLVAIGTSLIGNANAELWLEDVMLLREITDCEFEAYEYLFSDATDVIWSYEEDVKMAWSVDALSLEAFWSIFDALARDGDLSGFDNWEGRCTVTYKPVGAGDGWLRRRISPYLLLVGEWIELYA